MTARPRQRDAHSVMIEQWLDEVLADPTTKRMDFSIAWAVSLHFNRTTRVAWAAVDEYAKRCHTDRRTVQRSLRRLESAGHLPPFSTQKTAVPVPLFPRRARPERAAGQPQPPRKQRCRCRPTS
jgi:hypothetical protein